MATEAITNGGAGGGAHNGGGAGGGHGNHNSGGAWANRRHPLIKAVVEENCKPKHISHVNFGMMSGTEMMRVSHIKVSSRELYQMPTRQPAKFGCLDPRLGISNKADTCQTCNGKLADCAGHYGYIQLALPCFHIGFFKATLGVLQTICKKCSRPLLDEQQRRQFLARMRSASDALYKAKVRKQIVELCKKAHRCPWCETLNGTVKKLSGPQSLKIVHERFKGKDSMEAKSEFLHSFDKALKLNPEMGPYVQRTHEDLNPLHVQELFMAIPDADLDLVWANPVHGRPENMILTHLQVPPVCIRPSVAMDTGGGSNEDDLTVKLQEIIHINNALELAVSNGATMKIIMEDWDFLQVQVAMFLNGELPGLPPILRSKKPIRGLCQRLKGKQGRFRGNLLGKRVDFSGRTVISPDPNLRIEQVGVPEHVAKVMTYPEVVNRTNIARLRVAVLNGPVYPGANQVILRSNGMIKSLKYGDRSAMARNLSIGDIVERHMIDGDVVLFNRQPSLHKMSIMAHRARVMPWRTFRFNECCCAPYNADFDGDEMNLHLPQTEEARTEAALLMDVRVNMITPRSGEPLIAACQDFLTSSFVLTQRDMFLTRDEFCNAIAAIGDGLHHYDIPPPAIWKPVQLWTGKQVMGLVLRPNAQSNVLVNMEERNYSGAKKEGGEWRHLCPEDGYVVFRNSELMCGNLCKTTLGGSKKGLIYCLIRDHSPNDAAMFLHRLTKMCTRWFTNWGFSIGIEDVMPVPKLNTAKLQLLDEGYNKCDKNIQMYKSGKLQLQAGCNEEQSLEAVLNGILGQLRDTVGKMCQQELPTHNAPRIMATCGSKGSTLNICQMVACVGQQSVNGARIAEGFVDRTLPIFVPKSKEPAAKGFVANSFFSGLTATEFFFHTMGGREGLVDTAVKTAETGYMQRRLMKVLEDLSVQYDNTVRTSTACVVQFRYGDDGLDPAYMEPNNRPVEFGRLALNVRAHIPGGNEPALTPSELRAVVAERLMEPDFLAVQEDGQFFVSEVQRFVASIEKDIVKRCTELGVKPDDWNSASPEHRAALNNTVRYTRAQVRELLSRAYFKFQRSMIEPGEAVGALGAHSLGEPATQMTLKTFHFAGVASMNVTLGVPRIKEIINASSAISTPIIEAALIHDGSEAAARIVKGRIEKTTIGEVSKYVQEVYAPDDCFLCIKLDLATISGLHLSVTPNSVRQALLRTPPLKLKEHNVSVRGDDEVIVRPPATGYRMRGASREPMRGETYFSIQTLKVSVPKVIVQGIATVNRAVITEEESRPGHYKLLVEGYNLMAVMGTPGVKANDCRSNHIIEVESTLGIEAARRMIMSELDKTYSTYGIDIDRRHLMLLGDVMTYRGQVLGITRFGIAKMKDSVLMLASFEKTPDHLFDAAVHSRVDEVAGVSECIIMGIPIPLGTGLFKLIHQPNIRRQQPPKRPLLLHSTSGVLLPGV